MTLLSTRMARSATVVAAILCAGGGQLSAADPQAVGKAEAPLAAAEKPDQNTPPAWLTVTTDPAEIAAARKAAAAAVAERYENLFRGLGSPHLLDDEDRKLIDGNRVGSIARLMRMLNPGAVTNEAVGAALVLCELREAPGRAYAARILREGSPRQKLWVLNGIGHGIHNEVERKKYGEFLFAEPGFVTPVLALLENEDEKVVQAAVQCCGYLDVPGAKSRFLTLLAKPNPPDRARLLYWMSRGEITEEVFRYALETNDVNLDDPWGAVSIFEAAAASKSKSIRRRAKTELRALLAASPDDGRGGFTGSRLEILSALSKAADKTDRDWLLKLAESERGSYAYDPLLAFVRLFPDDGRRRLLAQLDDGERRRTAVQVAEKYYAKTNDAEIVRALTKQVDAVADRDLPELLTALIKVGGKASQPTIERVAKRLDPDYLSHFRQQFDPPTYGEIARAVREAGLLPAVEIDAALRELAKMRDDATKRETSDEDEKPANGDSTGGKEKISIDQAPGDLESLFEAANSTVWFDVETGSLPCRHDQLVEEFAKGSRGRFRPEAVLEIWHQKNPNDFEGPYTLQFVVKTRLYRAELRNLDDWYDAERVVQMINIALAEARLDERFLNLATGDQTARFVFADPKPLVPLAEKFGMRLSDDVEEAMRKGKEFEERVRRDLEERGK